MKEVILNGKKVRLYDSIDELPIVRFHKYNRMLLIDAGIGSDISDFDAHIEKVVRWIRKGDNENAAKEMENMRQNIYMVMSEQSVRHLSFACLVESIDGKVCDDLSPDGLEAVLKQLGGTAKKDITTESSEVKKKIDDELSLYFPSLFDDVRTREYYDLLKRLTLARIGEITGEGTEERTKAIEEQMVLYAKPKTFTGRDGLEVKHDKDFESMCILITKETGREAKKMTVLEYYNAYEWVVKQHKAQNKAR